MVSLFQHRILTITKYAFISVMLFTHLIFPTILWSSFTTTLGKSSLIMYRIMSIAYSVKLFIQNIKIKKNIHILRLPLAHYSFFTVKLIVVIVISNNVFKTPRESLSVYLFDIDVVRCFQYEYEFQYTFNSQKICYFFFLKIFII